jgi:hypothetical protein
MQEPVAGEEPKIRNSSLFEHQQRLKGVAIGIEFQRKLGTGLFGGEEFIMQKLEGMKWHLCRQAAMCCQEICNPVNYYCNLTGNAFILE